MTSTFLRTGALAAGLLTAASLAAQQPVPQPVPAPAAQPAPGVPAVATQYRAKQILGTKILINNNTAVGTVDDIVFDAAGNMDYLIVENGGKLTTVPFDAAKLDVTARTAVVPLTAEQYQRIPTYTPATYPSFYSPTYRTEMYRYYDLTPRELRRLGPVRRP